MPTFIPRCIACNSQSWACLNQTTFSESHKVPAAISGGLEPTQFSISQSLIDNQRAVCVLLALCRSLRYDRTGLWLLLPVLEMKVVIR